MELVTKIIRELKSPNNQDDTIRYDFIKLLINPFLGEINNKEDFYYSRHKSYPLYQYFSYRES